MEVADSVVVMSQGNIEQVGAPDDVWREPATRFVLEFLGEVNRFDGEVHGSQFHVGAHRWPLGYTPAHQGDVELFLRPWEVDVSRQISRRRRYRCRCWRSVRVATSGSWWFSRRLAERANLGSVCR